VQKKKEDIVEQKEKEEKYATKVVAEAKEIVEAKTIEKSAT
jgi:hypothetical protein